jgi:hypothetical protein
LDGQGAEKRTNQKKRVTARTEEKEMRKYMKKTEKERKQLRK